MKGIRNVVSGFVAIILLCFSQDVNATHIVGADMSFTCKGEEWFMINLTVRRDCNNGDPEAVFDDPAYVGIFDAYGTPLSWLGTLGSVKMELLSVDDIGGVDPGCDPNGEGVCVSEARYVGKAYLPFREKGYILSYQRCCRNATLNNVLNPTEVGNTSFVCITEESMTACNNSPSFQEWPDLYICAGEQLVFNSAGVDVDGDDLRYTLYTPLAGASIDMPQPIPPAGPPYDEVIYAPGYSVDNQLGSGVPLSIDYNTGVITAQPEVVGQFLVGVLIEEWRDGVMLSKTRRNFEYNVRNCNGTNSLSFNSPAEQCEGLTVTVENTSNDGGAYKWNFNYPSDDPAFMSTEANPSFTYPSAGDYTIQLTSTSGVQLCNTEVIRQVKVINSQLSGSFDNATPVCSNDLITIDLTSTVTEGNSEYSITESRYEIIIDGAVYPFSGGTTTAIVPCANSISIVHYVTSSSGCTLTETKVYNNIQPTGSEVSLSFLGNALTICAGGSTRLISNPNPEWTYTWTPTTGLSFPNGNSDPVASPDVTTTYSVTVSNGESTTSGEVTVAVQSAFLDVSIVNNSGTCGGEVNLSGVASNGGSESLIYEWSFDPNFATVVARGQTVNIPVNGNSAIYMRAGGGTFCGSNVPSISLGDLTASGISASFSQINTCGGNTGSVSVVNSNPNETYTVVWEPTGNITSGLTGQTVNIAATDGQTEIPLTYTATTSGGCVKTETIIVPVVSDLVIDISSVGSEDCTGSTYQALSNAALDMTNFEWSLDPNFTTILSTDQTVTVDAPAGSTLYLRATANDGACASDVVTREIMSGMEALAYDAPSRICLGDTADIDLITPDGDALTVVWASSPEIIAGSNDTKVIVVGMNTGNANLSLAYTATNQAGCSFSGTIDIPYSTIIPPNADPEVECGTYGMAFSIDPIYQNGDVFWDFGVVNGVALTSTEAQPTIDFGAAGSYTGTLTSTMETCNFDAMSVSFVVPEILEITTDDDLDQSTCDGGDPNLTLGASSVSDIIWTDQDGNVLSMTDSVTVDRSAMTSITATVSDTFGCDMTLVFDVSKYDFDVTIMGPGIDGGEPACGDSVNLNATDNTGANVSYMWTSAMGGVISGGDTANPTIDPSNAGDLVLTVTNEDLGCSMDFPVPVDGSGGITASINATPGTTITSGESVTLDVVTDATGATYEWADDGSTNGSRVVMPTETTTYTVTVTDENGCTAEATITITVEDRLCSNYMVPEAFTPNGDGNNDVLLVRSDGDLDALDFQVLDRWGNEVFRTMNQNTGWNGFHQNDGSEMAPDVFAYCLKVTCNGQEEVIAGSVSLIR